MRVDLVMPKAGLTMIEGTIFAWKVEEGAAVKKGDVVMEFENEKTTMQCEANADGFIHIIAAAGSVVKVGEVIANIVASKAELSDAPQAKEGTPAIVGDVHDIVMPKAGLTMIEGTVGEWKVSEGDKITKGQPVFDFENEKTTMDAEATAEGYIHIIANQGDLVKVGVAVAKVAATKEGYDALVAGGASAVVSEAISLATQKPQAAVVHISSDGHIRATGLARNIAKSAGVVLAEISGTGPNGRIIASDVYAHIEKAKSAPTATAPTVKFAEPTGEVVKTALTGMRKAIAKNMRKSFETMAPLTVFAEVDVTDLMEMRKKYVANQEILGCKISMNDILMLAATKNLKKYPIMNSTFDGETITTYPYINLGMAVGLEAGLLVPVLKNADQHSLTQMSKALKDLAIRAQEGALVGGEQSGATFTVTNVGMYNIDFGTPVISPPQVAILGFGTAKKKFVEYKGEFCPRTMMYMMLSFDHQVIDGRQAGEFMGDMKTLLENPELIFV